ncbi:MAG: membrane protein insertion efficiency factor YidD [Gammaproteobacteria bacterium]|nr:membrane protein insertion efficiency factor YidD [Gammaproteobacteria bacterium]
MQLVLLYTIKGYSYFISPILGQNCRFYPSCSQYAQEALKKYGSLKGTYLTIKRLLKCHPWCIGGIDLLK